MAHEHAQTNRRPIILPLGANTQYASWFAEAQEGALNIGCRKVT